MEELVNFLNANEFKKKELADFLGISVQFLGQILRGERKLPYDKLKQIKANDRGWNADMLPEGRIVQTIGTANNCHNFQNNSDCELWKKLCEEKDKRIAILEDYITLLQSKIEN